MLTNYRSLVYFEAILFILLGLLAIALPQIFTIGLELLIGSLFLIGGIFQFIRLFQSKNEPGFWGTFGSGLINILLGLMFLFYPIAGVLSLTFLLIAYFLIDGLTKIYMSLQLKSYEKWGWVLFSGIVSIFLALLLLTGMPGTAVWALGLLVGINMLFFGFALFALASSIPDEKI